MVKEEFEIFRKNTLVIGTGAAGLNAAIHFVEEGGDPNQLLIVTEKLGGGTSFNAGSDKQTYYKLSLSGNEPDSVYQMAQTYWNGGSMHGDIALVESANSIREFMHLVSLGVPFPTNKYGEYIGYKTDNDPLQRATSVGPLTSKVMGEALLKRVNSLGIQILDHVYCCKIHDLGTRKLIIGIKNTNFSQKIPSDSFSFLKQNTVVFYVDNIIVATGGSSSIYQHSVYPESQWGSLGLLIDYGCETQNLTESQFGLASTDFRWNVSGTYQQVIPTYLSCAPEEKFEQANEFLNAHFPSNSLLLNAIFLKGYQWPFNATRIRNHGSSLIDLLVFKEITEKGRDVYLDFTKNPYNLSISKILDTMDEEFSSYLTKSGVQSDPKFETPIERLRKINPKAYQLYLSHGIDLQKTPLAISVCAQHCNGGISSDIWWESSKQGVFVIGEANGNHGVHRPGGAALNSGQVGGLRASLKIIHGYYNTQMAPSDSNDNSKITQFVSKFLDQVSQIIENHGGKKKNSHQILQSIRRRMSKYGTIIRTSQDLQKELNLLDKQILTYMNDICVTKPTMEEFLHTLHVYDSFVTHTAYLHSIDLYLTENGGSRGSYLVQKSEKYLDENAHLNQYVIKTQWDGKKFKSHLEKTRDIPKDENWFETIWNAYENGSWIN